MAVTLGKQRDDAVQAREALQQSGRAQAGESWPAPEDLHRKLKEIKREAPPSRFAGIVLAPGGRGRESLAVSNLPSIALAQAHLTGWTVSLTRTPAWRHVMRRCPDASCSPGRERR